MSTSDRPKANVFIVQCVGNQNSSVERFFATSNQLERYLCYNGSNHLLSNKNNKKLSDLIKRAVAKCYPRCFQPT